MNRTSLFTIVGGLLIAVGAGCQAIAGLQSRTTDPLPTNACALPSSGNGRIRLADLANVGPGSTQATNIANYTDFCIKPSSSSNWGRPIFRDGGNDSLCLGNSSQPGGMTYGLVTVPFAVPVGNIDVKAIPSGQTCSATGTSELDNIPIKDSVTDTSNPPTTIVRWGGGASTAEGISALVEYSGASNGSNESVLRIVNALSGGEGDGGAGESIEFGSTGADTNLPAYVTSVNEPNPIRPGGIAPPEAQSGLHFEVDSAGYMIYPPQPFNLSAFIAADATQAAIGIYQQQGAVYGSYYAIGDPTDKFNAHPPRGLYCDEKLSAATEGGADGGITGPLGNVPAGDLGLFSLCTLTPLSLISYDLVNVSEYGFNAPFLQAREQVIPTLLAARTSDLMCVVESNDHTNRNAIIQAAAGTTGVADSGTGTGYYPYYYDVTSTVNTQPTLAADQHTTTAPPCAGNVSPTAVQNWINCVYDHCSTVSNDTTGQGFLNGGSSCLEGPCLSELVKLYTYPQTQGTGSTQYEDNQCFDCTTEQFLSVALGNAQNCVTEAEPGFVFNGEAPELILSHYPFANVPNPTKVYYLPSTGFRRAVLKATIQLEDQQVDFFCAQLTSPFIDSSLPYTGFYGNDLTSPYGNGWEDEQDLQANEVVAWVESESKADGLPAILAADLHASVASGAEDAGVGSTSKEVITAFTGATTTTSTGATVAEFQVAQPQNYVVQCDYCQAPQNPYNYDVGGFEILHSYLVGFPNNATQSESLWGTDNNAVSLAGQSGAPSSGFGPAFEYYPHNYQVLRPNP